MTDWQDLVAWMRSPEVQAAVARCAEPEDETVQAALWEEDGAKSSRAAPKRGGGGDGLDAS